MHVAANSPETVDLAGALGLPLILATNINPLPRLPELLARYRRARAEGGHAPAGEADVTVLLPTFVGESRAAVRAAVEPSVLQFADLARTALLPAVRRASSEAERAKLETLVERLGALDYAQVDDVMGVYDTPEAAVERLTRIKQELGVGRFITWFNFGGRVPHADVLASMELFAERVAPRL
jgi:alkanesulfonate monooxygenase SsuD/methylene tetrahydromethanopterin reductase-like flavin-dependent oxidoreductase (luciferase family)